MTTTGQETDASGNHTFDRFNPAVGATYTFTEHLSLYAGYSESYRAPTAIELTCANPEAPCPVPTAIVDDPPLNAVKGKTWETGVRWALPPYVDATLAFFRTDLKDDILFRNEPGEPRAGVFSECRRHPSPGHRTPAARRVELGQLVSELHGNGCNVLTMRLSCLRSPMKSASPWSVRETAWPLVPPHRVNGGIEFLIGSQLRLSLDGAYVDGQRLRGDEANQRSRLDPYFVANVMRWSTAIRRLISSYVSKNIFDEEYESYGAYFENAVDDTGVETLYGAGAAVRGLWRGTGQILSEENGATPSVLRY